ncbi:hypothetical protein [Nocardia macrotermitis]|uniref:Cyclase n=1 Tax=Nocardia macrotermitis TaxID=2585198 RepID=A0A7K0CU09_9NOCA|nr:hypothetical protein [Nocardia macrotermitis]MQY16959.1 hypothetical protein [Nocardia macrotermitis]
MTTLITRHRVENFETWRTAFAAHRTNRRTHGATAHRIYRTGNDITVLTDFPTPAAVEAFLTDPALRAIIARAGFIGTPTTEICDLVDDENY